MIDQKETQEWSCEHTTKDCIVYISQLTVCLIIIITSIINLTLDYTSNRETWLVLLSSCLGYLLPSPTLKKN